MLTMYHTILKHTCIARTDVARMALKKLHDMNYELLPHPPYSPDLSPTDHHLFRHLANHTKNKKYETITDLKSDIDGFIAAHRPTRFTVTGSIL